MINTEVLKIEPTDIIIISPESSHMITSQYIRHFQKMFPTNKVYVVPGNIDVKVMRYDSSKDEYEYFTDEDVAI